MLTANNGSAVTSKEEIVLVTTGLKSQLNGTDQTLADLEETLESGLNLVHVLLLLRQVILSQLKAEKESLGAVVAAAVLWVDKVLVDDLLVSLAKPALWDVDDLEAADERLLGEWVLCGS